jgi:hypothetical protein
MCKYLIYAACGGLCFDVFCKTSMFLVRHMKYESVLMDCMRNMICFVIIIMNNLRASIGHSMPTKLVMACPQPQEVMPFLAMEEVRLRRPIELMFLRYATREKCFPKDRNFSSSTRLCDIIN